MIGDDLYKLINSGTCTCTCRGEIEIENDIDGYLVFLTSILWIGSALGKGYILELTLTCESKKEVTIATWLAG